MAKVVPERVAEAALVKWVLSEADIEELAIAYSRFLSEGPIIIEAADGSESREYLAGRPVTRLQDRKDAR